jgi:hypothetical protein
MRRPLAFSLAATLTFGFAFAQDAKTPAPTEPPKVITGQCHCGQAKYTVAGNIAGQSYCDCKGCQKASGTLKTPFVTFSQKDFSTTGKIATFRSDSGVKCDANGTWHFCPTCGTHLFWKPHKGHTIDIFAGTLDDTSLFKPDEK